MKFTHDDFPGKKADGDSSHDSGLTDAIEDEHPRQLLTLAEQRIMSMHHHQDGSVVELHEVGSREFIAQSMAGSLEGKLTGKLENLFDDQIQQLQQNNPNSAKIEYEKKTSQPMQLYGAQQSVTGVAHHGQDTMMMGCNCGLEWTVTGVSMKKESGNPGETIKIEQYGSPSGGGAAGYAVTGGNSGGGGPGEYRTGSGGQQGYKG